MATSSADGRCTAIGLQLWEYLRESELNVRERPADAPKCFITPNTIKSIIKSGPIEQLLFCVCKACEKYSGCSADDRKSRFRNGELDDTYFTLFALLLTERCAGLMWVFRQKQISLDRRIYKEGLGFLQDFLARSCGDLEIRDVVRRILENQFKFFAKPLKKGYIDFEYDANEALPIDEDKDPIGKGGFAEVYAFKILKEYQGSGYEEDSEVN